MGGTITLDGKTSVMIVDDDESILMSLSIVLRRKYAVQTYNSAERAVAQAREAPPDIIVLDIKMPEHDGFWVFREIRKFNNQVPIIFNSAFQDMVPPEDFAWVLRAVWLFAQKRQPHGISQHDCRRGQTRHAALHVSLPLGMEITTAFTTTTRNTAGLGSAALAALALCLTACSHPLLSGTGRQVILFQAAAPAECTALGPVIGHAQGSFVYGDGLQPYALNDMVNQAANLGATHVRLLSTDPSAHACRALGVALKCKP